MDKNEDKYGILHDYVIDDLSVDYNSAKKFHEYLMSLKRHYEKEKKMTVESTISYLGKGIGKVEPGNGLCRK